MQIFILCSDITWKLQSYPFFIVLSDSLLLRSQKGGLILSFNKEISRNESNQSIIQENGQN